MIAPVPYDIPIKERPLRVREFFLARQPILDRNQDLVAYELLFRNAAVGPANITTDLSATATVIAHASQLGLEKVIGNALGYLRIFAARKSRARDRRNNEGHR